MDARTNGKREKEMKRALGFENSNSRIKGTSDLKTLNYVNTLKKVRESNTSKLMGNQNAYEVNGVSYIPGVQGGNGSGSKNESRYYSDQFKLESSIALSQMCNHDDKLQIITGVPANLAEREDIIEKIKYNLIDTYDINHMKAKKHFTVEKVNIVSQPVGTLWSILYDLDGRRRPDHKGNIDNSIFKKKFLIIDIGYGTTDMIELSAYSGLGQNKTLTTAMSDYISNLYNTVEKVYPDSRLSSSGITPYEVDEMLVKSDVLSLPRGEFNVGEIKRNLQRDFAEDIIQSLNQYSYNFEEYHQIILTGGGSIIMQDEIKRAFEYDPRITLADNPIMANVIGFYILAKQSYK